jgi:hypothetical protein
MLCPQGECTRQLNGGGGCAAIMTAKPHYGSTHEDKSSSVDAPNNEANFEMSRSEAVEDHFDGLTSVIGVIGR